MIGVGSLLDSFMVTASGASLVLTARGSTDDLSRSITRVLGLRSAAAGGSAHALPDVSHYAAPDGG